MLFFLEDLCWFYDPVEFIIIILKLKNEPLVQTTQKRNMKKFNVSFSYESSSLTVGLLYKGIHCMET